jgi:hypothetical protein
MDPANNATSSQAMSNPSNAQQFPPPPPIWPTGYMQQNPVDCNIMGNINFPSPGQGPTTMWAPIQPGNTSSQSTMIPASQSALYWNHYMNFVRNPLGSVGMSPYTDSYPPSLSSTPLQGSNTIPEMPVHLESDAEHSVQDINFFLDNGREFRLSPHNEVRAKQSTTLVFTGPTTDTKSSYQ